MKNFYLLLISILLANLVLSQTNQFQNEFENAYLNYPDIPRGLLEGVAFAQTRIQHIESNQESCLGLPQTFGVMGLTEDGEGYFNDNLLLCSKISGIGVNDIKTDPKLNVLAYATALNHNISAISESVNLFYRCKLAMVALSEIPNDHNSANQFALNSFTYEVFKFMMDPEMQSIYNFPDHNIQLDKIYNEEVLGFLQAENVLMTEDGIIDKNGSEFPVETKTSEYGPALWVATPSCNYSSRSGTPISAVTIHTIQGTYAGAISWAQNCAANVSYHYVVRSSDGQITQMLYEADKGWHVGSENPYTIGIEHEGYVDNPAWYTTALYTASADLVKDITQSGYGINPLRTFQGPATSGLNTLGSCIRIKGHQHYPSQSHTDPGINWDWEYYYQLINNNPTISSFSASTGTIYDTGGAGSDYGDDERELYLIAPTGALSVTISFAVFELETNWDYLYVYDGSTTTSPLLGTFTGNSNPGSITSTSGEILIEFRSDCNTTAAGYEINWNTTGSSGGDNIAPSSAITFSGNWKTTDFTVDFTDTDNSGGSGVDQTFYQVIDYDGTEWRANANNGFFSDNFDNAIHPEWTTVNGTWNITSNVLQQSNETDGNTNIYADLDQDNDDIFLYHWAMKIDGAGSNKRGGLHFMCDDPTLPNRGNSYFVWLRADDNAIQIYKVVSDVFVLEADIPYMVNQGQWYDIKTVFDKNTGQIDVWIDNSLEAQWTDPNPYTTGNSISLRSGDSNLQVNNLKVYHNRTASEVVTVGATGDIRYQNPDPLTSSGKVKSIVIDSANNISSIAQELVDVDWTNPADVAVVNDGTGADVNIITTNTEISGNWPPSSDQHSDIARYWYAIGTTSGGTDIVNWTDNWFDTTFTHAGLSLTYGTTYYVSVQAENGAGLLSNVITSDGQLLQVPTNPPTANFVVNNTYICSSDSVLFSNSSADASTYEWQIPGASPSSSTDVNPYFQFAVSGTYEVTLIATGGGGTDTLVQSIVIDVSPAPVADFTPSNTIVDISNAFVLFTNNSTGANGYLWDFGDGNQSSDYQPWHEYGDLGTYTVMLIAINGSCPNDTTYVDITVVGNLGMTSNLELDYSVYPNPTNDFLNINWGNDRSDSQLIQLFDSRGRIVFEKSVDPIDELYSIDLQNEGLEKGIYLIKISSDNGVYQNKFIFK